MISNEIKKQVNAKKLKKNNLFTCRPAVRNGQNVVVITFDEDCRIIYADKTKNEVIITGVEVIDDDNDSPVKEKTLEEKTKEEQEKKVIADLKQASDSMRAILENHDEYDNEQESRQPGV